MTLPLELTNRLHLPIMAAPMFIVSGPELVKAQCRAGIIGSFPALNARPQSQLREWLAEIREDLDGAAPRHLVGPFAVNLIVHKTNARVEKDLEACIEQKVPIIITSMGVRSEVIEAVHAYGGLVFHDVVNLRFAHKAVEHGVDGLIAVAAGAGGHAGSITPFALIEELRRWFDGPLVLSGAIGTGRGILAARVLGADLAYIGSAFIATNEANAPIDYKRMIVEGTADDIVYTSAFSGVNGNYLKPSIRRAGLDPANLPPATDYESSDTRKVWKDIWSAGQGIGAVSTIMPAADLILKLADQYRQARRAL